MSSKSDDQALVSIGPFKGLDTSTGSFHVNPSSATSMSNVVPYRQYGAYYSARGRTAISLASITNPVAVYKPKTSSQSTPYIICQSSGVSTSIYTGNSLSGSGPNVVLNTLPGGSNFVSTDMLVAVYNGIVYFITIGGTNYAYNLANVGSNTYWQMSAPPAGLTFGSYGAGNLTGTYYYRVTFQSSGTPAKESSPSPAYGPVSPSAQSVSVINIPLSPDPQCTARNIYRLGGSLGGTWFLVGTINDNTTTTFTDNLADANVTGQSLVMHRDPPPVVNVGVVGLSTHKERIWLLIGNIGGSYQNVLYYSNYAEPWGFDTTNQIISFSGSDNCVATSPLSSILLVFKERSTHAIYGDSQQDFIARKLFDIGCISGKSVTSAYGGVFWLSNQGIFYFDGSTPQNITGNIATSLRSNYSDFTNAVGFCHADTFYLSFPNNNVTYGYHMLTKEWHQIPYGTKGAEFDLENQPSALTIGEVIALNPSKTGLDNWFNAETDYGSNIASSWTTGVLDSGAPAYTKRYSYCVVEAPVQSGVSCTLLFTVDPGYGTPGKTFSQIVTLNKPRVGFTLGNELKGGVIQVQISASTNTGIEIDRITIYGGIDRSFVQLGG